MCSSPCRVLSVNRSEVVLEYDREFYSFLNVYVSMTYILMKELNFIYTQVVDNGRIIKGFF